MQNPLTALRETLKPYDIVDLLSSVAGLQLMPENADQALRLEAFAEAAASLPYEKDKPTISSGRFKAICQGPQLCSLVPCEDPYNNPFTEAVPFFGGSFVVIPGLLDDAGYIFRQFVRGLFFGPTDFPSSEYRSAVRRLISAALVVSNEVASCAGLGRGVLAHSRDKQPIIIPSSAQLSSLKRAVVFEDAELRHLLRRFQATADDLAPITLESGRADLAHFNLSGGALSFAPIVRVGDQIVVALPGALLSAVWGALISLALDMGVSADLALRLSFGSLGFC